MSYRQGTRPTPMIWGGVILDFEIDVLSEATFALQLACFLIALTNLGRPLPTHHPHTNR